MAKRPIRYVQAAHERAQRIAADPTIAPFVGQQTGGSGEAPTMLDDLMQQLRAERARADAAAARIAEVQRLQRAYADTAPSVRDCPCRACELYRQIDAALAAGGEAGQHGA